MRFLIHKYSVEKFLKFFLLGGITISILSSAGTHCMRRGHGKRSFRRTNCKRDRRIPRKNPRGKGDRNAKKSFEQKKERQRRDHGWPFPPSRPCSSVKSVNPATCLLLLLSVANYGWAINSVKLAVDAVVDFVKAPKTKATVRPSIVGPSAVRSSPTTVNPPIVNPQFSKINRPSSSDGSPVIIGPSAIGPSPTRTSEIAPSIICLPSQRMIEYLQGQAEARRLRAEASVQRLRQAAAQRLGADRGDVMQTTETELPKDDADVYDYQNKATLGPEFTFYNQEVDNGYDTAESEGSIKLRYMRELETEMLKRCKTEKVGCKCDKKNTMRWCKMEVSTGDFSFWLQFSQDHNSLEFQAKPMTLEDWEKHDGLVQKLLFESARKVVLNAHPGNFYDHVCPKKDFGTESDSCKYYDFCEVPFNSQEAETFGGGHIHFGLNSTFHNDAFLFANFLVDLQNNPYLGLGALTSSPRFSPPLAIQAQEKRDRFGEITSYYQKLRTLANIDKIRKRITFEVYDNHRGINCPFNDRKFQFACLNHRDTIELRFPRPQEKASDFTKLSRLFLKRIEFLDRCGVPIKYKNSFIENEKPEEKRLGYFYRSDKELEKAAAKFYRYVVDIGLDWEEYKELLHPLVKEKIHHGCIQGPIDNPYSQTGDASSFPV